MARARTPDGLPRRCTGRCPAPVCTCGACSCSWCWSVSLVAVLYKQLLEAMLNNPGLNFLICFVLVAGIFYAFSQVLRLYPEIRWVNAFRIADPGLSISHRPVLLAPMATMLRDRTGSLSLSATSMRSILDSIGSRLDEARDTGRYLVGLLVFLGPARHLLGPARHHHVGRQDHQLHRHPGVRQRHRVRRAEERPGRAAARHGHGVLVLAAGSRRLAGAGLPGAAGRPCAQPLLQSARGMAVRHHRAGARRLADRRLRQPPALCRHPRHAPRRARSQRAHRHHAARRTAERAARRTRRCESSPRASTSSCARCAPSRRSCANGWTSRPPSRRRWPPCSRSSPPTCPRRS